MADLLVLEEPIPEIRIPASLKTVTDDNRAEAEREANKLKNEYLPNATRWFDEIKQNVDFLVAAYESSGPGKTAIFTEDAFKEVDEARKRAKAVFEHKGTIIQFCIKAHKKVNLSRGEKTSLAEIQEAMHKTRQGYNDIKITIAKLNTAMTDEKTRHDLKIRSEFEIRNNKKPEKEDDKFKAVQELQPPKLEHTDRPSTLVEFCRRFKAYFDASNFVKASMSVQANYFLPLISQHIINKMCIRADESHWIYPEQCIADGKPACDSFMAKLEAAWLDIHPPLESRAEYLACYQKSGESYTDYTSRVDKLSTMANLEEFMSNEAAQIMKGYIIYLGLANREIKREVAKLYRGKKHLVKEDIDTVAANEESADQLSRVTIFENGRLGPPPHNLNKINHRDNRRSRNNDQKHWSKLYGDAKHKALKQANLCTRCAKNHDVKTCFYDPKTGKHGKIPCSECGTPGHTGQACLRDPSQKSKERYQGKDEAARRGTKRTHSTSSSPDRASKKN